MVAIFTGPGAGLARSSASALGGSGLLGSALVGRAGESIAVNAATGNLVISRQDEFLTGRGLDLGISRTYNSLAEVSDGDNGDQWQMSTARRVFGFVGPLDTVGSTIKRVSGDGSVVDYVYGERDLADGSGSEWAYWATDGDGAHDKLVKTGSYWVWTDGSSQVTEKYEADPGSSGSWRIIYQRDSAAQKLTFAYDAGNRLDTVTTANGEYVKYVWDESPNSTDIVSIETGFAHPQTGEPVVWNTVDYSYTTYGSQRRLTGVEVDLSPEAAGTTDGHHYSLSYEYYNDGDHNDGRLKAVSQDDGSRTEITYFANGRVRWLTERTNTDPLLDEPRITTFVYNQDPDGNPATNSTKVIAPNGQATMLTFDVGTNMLLSIEAPPAYLNAAPQVQRFEYDADENLTKTIAPDGSETLFEYDEMGNVVLIDRPVGSDVDRWYDAKNQLVRELSYGSNEANDSISHNTRYVYDTEGHLRYRISAGGLVTEFRYDSYGQRNWEVEYTADPFAISSTVPTLADMDDWRDTQADLSRRTFVYQKYDARGNVEYVTRYSAATSAGAHDPTGGLSRTYYAYDQAGRLLSRYEQGEGAQETFVYDGLGRLVASSDRDGGVTTVFFDDAQTRTVMQMSSGLTRTLVYNKAGDLISQIDSSLGRTTANLAPALTSWASGSTLAPMTVGSAPMNGGTLGSHYTYTADGARNYVRTGVAVTAGETVRYRITFRGDGTSTTHRLGLHGTNSGWGTNLATDARAIIVSGPGRLTQVAGGNWQVDGVAADADTTIEIVRTYAQAETARAYFYIGGTSQVTEGTGVILGAVSLVKTTADAALAFEAETLNEYDKLGRLRISGDEFDENARTWHVFDKAGRKTGVISRMTDLDGVTVKYELTEYVYDANNRVIGTIVYDDSVSSSVIGQPGDTGQTLENPYNTLEMSGIRPSGSPNYDSRTWTVYDAGGRVMQRVNGAGEVTGYEYDGMGRLVRTTHYATRLTTVWSATSPLTTLQAVTPDADHDAVTRTFYNRDGQVRATLDGEGYLTESIYDKAGRKTRDIAYVTAIKADHSTVDRATATFSAIREVVAPGGGDRRTHYVYNGQGLLLYTVDGLGYVTGYTYNAAQKLTVTTRYATKVAVSNGGYDLAELAGDIAPSATDDRSVTNVYDGDGRLKYVQDAVGTRTYYFYDAAGNVVRTQVGTDADKRITRNWYDARGNVRFSVDPEGYLRKYSYTDGGLLAAEAVLATPVTVTDTTTIDEVAAMSGTDYAETRYQYDELGRVVLEMRGEGTDGLMATAYHYRTDGRLLYRDDGYPGGPASSADVSRTWYTYDRAGRVVGVERARSTADATLTSYSYDALGNLDTVTHDLVAGGQSVVTDHEYDRLGRTTSSSTTGMGETHPGYTYAYNAFGEVVQATDPLGRSTYTYYDRLGRAIAVRDAENHVTETTYSAFGDIASITRRYNRVDASDPVDELPAPEGNVNDAVTLFEYDRRGLVTKTTDAEGFYESYGYDAYGNRTSVTAKSWTGAVQAGGTTEFEYDRRGLLVAEILPMASYTADGTLQASTVTHKHEYDARGNRVTTTEAFGLAEQRVTRYEYDSAGRLKKTIGEARSVLLSSHAASLTHGFEPTEELFYDRRGNVTKVVDAAGHARVFFYDDLDRKTVEIDALGTYTAYAYDAAGNVTSIWVYEEKKTPVPSNGGSEVLSTSAPPPGAYRETLFEYDALGRMTQSSVNAVVTGTWNGTAWTSMNASLVTEYAYDANGNVVVATDPNGNETYSYYDNLGRKTAQLDAGSYLTSWTYDAEGNVLRERRYATPFAGIVPDPADPHAANPTVANDNTNDRITDYTYDKVGNRESEARLSVRVHNGNGGTISTTATIGYSYNGLGQVVRRTEATGDYIDYAYDVAGRLLEEKRSGYEGHTGTTVTPEVDYSYDGLGNLVRTVAAGAAGVLARTTSYTYSEGGLLAGTTDAEDNTRSYFYDKRGLLLREQYVRARADGSAVTEAALSSYDALGRTVEQTVATKVGSTWVKGDIAATEYNTFGEVARSGVNGLWQTENQYDAAGRLWASNAGDGIWKYFGYDRNGNQTLAITGAGQDMTGLTFTQARNKIGQANVNGTYTTYDARNLALEVIEEGRQLAAGVTETLTSERSYNAFGEVASETNAAGATNAYTYNTMGRMTRSEGPAVETTREDGSSGWIKPSQDYYYDAGGRLVATRDANAPDVSYVLGGDSATAGSKAANKGNLTRLTLLAGTGYGGSEALVTEELHADQGKKQTLYDIHGDARVIRDELYAYTDLTTANDSLHFIEQEFNRRGEVIQVKHKRWADTALTSDTTRLIDNYEYDVLGQQVRHWNSQLGSGNAEITDYDIQGRVVSQRAFGGDTTTTSYGWDATVGGVGGWQEVTTMANGLDRVEQTDIFGRVRYKSDLGDHVFNYAYDNAGRLDSVTQGSATQTYTYFNTGKLKQIALAGTGGGSRPTTTYGYDAVGNLTSQSTFDNFGQIQTQTLTAAYDALGRMTSWSEAGNSITPAASSTITYDANGNVRSKVSTAYSLGASGEAGTQHSIANWFRYDSMNRVVLNNGVLYNGEIRRRPNATTSGYFYGTVFSPQSESITYNAAGQRTSSAVTEMFYDDYGGALAAQEQKEIYVYDSAGRLTQTRQATGTQATTGLYDYSPPPGATGNGVLRSQYGYDTMNRQVSQTDYDTNGYTQVFNTTTTYNAKGQVSNSYAYTLRSDNSTHTQGTTNYFFTNEYTGQYLLGAVAKSVITGTTSSTTTNSYQWWDGAVQSGITAATGSTTFYLNAFGQLYSAYIADGKNRTVTYRLDELGQVIRRDETDVTGQTGAPHEVWYRMGGREIGYVGNNSTTDVSMHSSIAQRRAVVGSSPGTFRFGSTWGAAAAEFTRGIDKINSYEQGSRAGSYTVGAGDTLQSLAQRLYGDASLWYKIAEANGLSGRAGLTEGQQLTLPGGVVRSTYNAGTIKPYDPAEAIGDLSPNTPKPAKKNKCGSFGMILLAVVAVAVSVLTYGALTGPATGLLGSIGAGAVSGAAGSVASQAVGVATGIQEKFSFKGVAMAAIGGAVGGALGGFNALAEGALGNLTGAANAAVRGIAGSAINQGIGVATGLQDKFSWAGVAAAGVGAAASFQLAPGLAPLAGEGSSRSFGNIMTHVGVNAASSIAGAATRSAIEGTSFGRNIIAGLPDVIGQAIGGALGGAALERDKASGQTSSTSGETSNASAPGVSLSSSPLDPTLFMSTDELQAAFDWLNAQLASPVSSGLNLYQDSISRLKTSIMRNEHSRRMATSGHGEPEQTARPSYLSTEEVKSNWGAQSQAWSEFDMGLRWANFAAQQVELADKLNPNLPSYDVDVARDMANLEAALADNQSYVNELSAYADKQVAALLFVGLGVPAILGGGGGLAAGVTTYYSLGGAAYYGTSFAIGGTTGGVFELGKNEAFDQDHTLGGYTSSVLGGGIGAVWSGGVLGTQLLGRQIPSWLDKAATGATIGLGTDFAGQYVDVKLGNEASIDVRDLLISTALGGTTALMPALEIDGLNAGRYSSLATYRSLQSRYQSGNINQVRVQHGVTAGIGQGSSGTLQNLTGSTYDGLVDEITE